jgi:hypothetical protein
MKNKKFRKIAILVAVMMLVMSFSSTGFASWLDQTIKASYRNITVFVNGTMKQAKTAQGAVVEPFIVDGTTYVPLRGISEMLGYQVTFNPTTYRIDITGADVSTLTNQILQQQITIKTLEDKVKALEAQLADNGIEDFEDMEEYLLDEYPTLGDLDIDGIVLDGDEDEIELEVSVYLKSSTAKGDWTELRDSRIKSYLQSLVDELLDEYDEPEVYGSIRDSYGKKTLVYFDLDKYNKVVLDYDDIDDDVADFDAEDLEDYLNDEFNETHPGKSFSVEVSIEVNEDTRDDELEVVISTVESIDITDSSKDGLTLSEMMDYLDTLYDVISDVDAFKDYTILGVIDDGMSVDIEFEFDPSSDYDGLADYWD